MDEHIFPQVGQILDEAIARHDQVWPFASEAVSLAHLAFGREREFAASRVPGVPCIRRVRNDINDNAWRILKMIAEPLIDEGQIQGFCNKEGTEFVVFPDGLHTRLKKGDDNGNTSNYPTPSICKRNAESDRCVLFETASELDKLILDGLGIDFVYAAGPAMDQFKYIGLRIATASFSPYMLIDEPTPEQLYSISPAAADLAAQARSTLMG